MNILSIDDNKNNLLIVEAHAKAIGATITSFLDPIEALAWSRETACDLVIVDYMMPHLNGLEFITQFRERDESTPIVMVTAVGDDIDLQVKALELGATDFLSKPIHGATFRARVTNLLKLKRLQNNLADEIALATKKIIEQEHETLHVLAKTAEYKDPETAAHVARVAHYSKLLASAYGLSERKQEILFHASPFHDIGKVGIADAILLKPARLNEQEFEVMKTHATIGFEILKGSQSEYLQAGGIIAFSHHEKYDGSGYPKGLSGVNIPILGRIVAIADVFDALTSKRPYKEPWTLQAAFAFLEEQKGAHFDPVLVDHFCSLKEEVSTIFYAISQEEEKG